MTLDNEATFAECRKFSRIFVEMMDFIFTVH
jgi:hypothetical protein